MSIHKKTAQRSIFGRRLRQAREWIAIPQDRLGVAIGLDETTSSARISRYETGVHEPPIHIARLLAEALNVPLAFLYCDDDELALMILVIFRMDPEDRKDLQVRMAAEWPEPPRGQGLRRSSSSSELI